METKTADISAQQKASWNKFSPGWKKWDDLVIRFLAPLGDAMIAHLDPKGTQRILDVAAGTGEPGLRIAERIPEGTVVITDLSDGMLQVAVEKAASAGLGNVEFREADANALPFPDDSFDAVSCRLGFMFFPDMAQAAREMARVLKPGGRIATVVWAEPERNTWMTIMVHGIRKHLDLPPPDPNAPGVFRCGRPEMMAELFAGAGFKNVAERDVPCEMQVDGPAQYWQHVTEIAAPVMAALEGADAETVERVKADVMAAVAEQFPEGRMPGIARIIVGEK
ncbi:MAG: methyltransferase domain-containing protein [Flavobacteriales bacterium]|nr:methyltransferase domain-containing protein [Flavobacteriales bacterium]MCB9166234.1 methyltransferase domain-containing protein [Flavobacteriales bacterium]